MVPEGFRVQLVKIIEEELKQMTSDDVEAMWFYSLGKWKETLTYGFVEL
jgi:hypothetical protein